MNSEKEAIFQEITYGSLPEEVRRIIFEEALKRCHGGGRLEILSIYRDYTELVERVVSVMGATLSKYPNLLKPYTEEQVYFFDIHVIIKYQPQ